MSFVASPPLRERVRSSARFLTTPPLPASLLGSPAAYLWLWLLPVAVMLLLNVQAYSLVGGEMNADQRQLAALIGCAGAANAAAAVLTALIARRRRRERARQAGAASGGSEDVPWWTGLPGIASQVAYLALAVCLVEDVLPATVTTWIYPPDRFVFNQFAFAMLPLFWGIVQVACSLPLAGGVKGAAAAVLMAIGAPLVLYVGFEMAFHAVKPGAVAVLLVATLFVVGGVVMFIGVVRALVTILAAAQRAGRTGERTAVVGVGFILPAAGLVLNRFIPFPVDFQAWEVYALLLINAVGLAYARECRGSSPLTSFGILCATLPFSLYFFVVLLPYTPLSILAVIVFGLGFLVLTPTLLLVLHVYLLNAARVELQRRGQWRRALVGGAACFAILPLAFNLRAVADKAALNSAIAYVTAPTVSADAVTYPGSLGNLRRALANHRHYKNGIYYPYLSDLYSWIVFNRLVLPDPLLEQLERTFVGATGESANEDPLRMGVLGGRSVRDRTRAPRAMPPPQTVEVAHLAVQTRDLPRGGAVFTLALTLHNAGAAQAEFVTSLPLPASAVVNGFRLQVGDAMVPGRIFERKAAQWVYRMIRDSERRDPGLLVFRSVDELELRVFPVAPQASTRVEIDYLLPQTVAGEGAPTAERDPVAVLSWVEDQLRPVLGYTDGRAFVAGHAPAGVQVTERPPYLHLIVDRSAGSGWEGNWDRALALLAARFPEAAAVRVTLANYELVDPVRTLTPIARLPEHLTAGAFDVELPRRGGLALDLAVAHALRIHRDLDLDSGGNALPPRPIVVLLSGASAGELPALPLSEEGARATGGFELHVLNADGEIIAQRDTPEPTPLLRAGGSVRAWVPHPFTFFALTTPAPSLEWWDAVAFGWRPAPGVGTVPESAAWTDTARLLARHADHAANPGASDATLRDLVQASRETGVLLPVTSYIAVENTAQWRMLEVAERQKLGRAAALEFNEAPAPSAWMLLGGALLWQAACRWRRRRTVSGEYTS